MERNRGRTDSRLLLSCPTNWRQYLRSWYMKSVEMVVLYAASFNYTTLASRVDCLSVRGRYILAAGSLLRALPKRFEVSNHDLVCHDRNEGRCVGECRE